MKSARYKKVIFSGVLVILASVMIAIYVFWFNQKCPSYTCLTFPEKNLWQVSDTYTSTDTSWKGLITAPKYSIRLYKVGNVSETSAEQFSKINTMTIDGLFDTARNPYVGVISDRIVCPDYLKPVEEDVTSKLGVDIHLIYSFLDGRMQYGACNDNEVSKKVVSGTFYCKNTSEWYQIEVIYSMNSDLKKDYLRNLFLDAGCQRPSVNTGKLLP